MIRDTLTAVIRRQDLSQEEMTDVMTCIMSGEVPDAQIGAFMGALATKGETFTELAGAAIAMRRKAVRITATAPVVVDTCGTGGDSLHTFNISTTAAFVVAGCGVTVAKHGNRSVSSTCGSADLLEYLGVPLTMDPEIMEEAVNEINIGFLFAPLYHGALRHAAKARKEAEIRSIFNMLGPLTNPAGANCQLLGVYAPELTEMFALALKELGACRAFIVHGHDGLDEISVCAPTRVSELRDGIIRTYDITPEQMLGRTARIQDLKGGDAVANAAVTKRVLTGEKGPHRDVVVVNAAAALVAAGVAETMGEGIQKAEYCIDNGHAQAKLDTLIQFAREHAA